MRARANTGPGRTLRAIAASPRLWRAAPIYLGVMLLAKLKAHEKLRKRREKVWERDDTSRRPG